MVAVLFLGGQGAMSTQHVEFEMDSLFYPDMDFSILPPTDPKRKGEKNGTFHLSEDRFMTNEM